MFQGDPTVRENSFSDSLGMEARSILRSIQTESAKLEQSSQIARSDLHYFRARFNYYRLSLMRLLPAEREILEPVLAQFMELITARESGEQEPPFFAEAIDRNYIKPVFEAPTQSQELKKVVDYRTKEATKPPASFPKAPNSEIVSELSLLKMALQAEPSVDGNRCIANAIERLIGRISH